MLVIIPALLGALIGALSARRRKGSVWDMAQYATVLALIFGLLGAIATLLIHRSLV